MKKPSFARYALASAMLMAGLFALPVLGHAQSVRVNWSKRAPFSSYKTYRFVPSKNDNHPFYRQYVSQYVNYDLKQKGLTEVSAAQSPALLVAYHFLTQQVTYQETSGFDGGDWGGWGGWGGWGMDGGMGGMDAMTTTPVEQTMGILTIDLIDARSKKIVWRGQATEDNVIKSNHGEEKEVAKSLKKMFDHFPPK